MYGIPTLSFCITCKNRLHQISQTLRQNLDDNILHSHLIEFILVDFGSDDGLKDWVLENFQEELKSKYLKFYYTSELEYWHASVAKNTAHLLASNDIVVNLDCDNYTGLNGGKFLIQQFSGKKDLVIHQFSGKFLDGSYGRISMYKKSFLEIGGYDEALEPMGGQDSDIIMRLTNNGHKCILLNNFEYNKAIPNSKKESLIYTGSKISWDKMNQKNMAIIYDNINNGRIVANNGDLNIKYNITDVYTGLTTTL